MTRAGSIDSHVHLWRVDRGDYGWMTDAVAPIRRDFLLPDLLAELDAGGIERAVLVQAAPTEAETEFLLGIARTSDRIAGVVGWVDLASSTADAALRRLAGKPKAVGIRPMLQDIEDRFWILQPTVLRNLACAAELRLVFDALVKPPHLPLVTALADHLPRLRIVLDHGGKPDLAAGDLVRWHADIEALARRPNVVCKLSGLLTEAGPDPTTARLAPAIDRLLTEFGPERLLFGSDWPVVNLAGSYAGWIELVRGRVSELSGAERFAVMGGNARSTYRLS